MPRQAPRCCWAKLPHADVAYRLPIIASVAVTAIPARASRVPSALASGGGTVVGDHSVIFAADNERIEIVHRAENRAIFAKGAARSGLALTRQPAGRYTMDQCSGSEIRPHSNFESTTAIFA